MAVALTLAGTALVADGGGAAFAADDLSACFAPIPVPGEVRLEAELSGQDIGARLLSLSAGPLLCLDWAERTTRLRPTEKGRAKAQVAVHCMACGKMPSELEGVLYFADAAGSLIVAIFPLRKGEKNKIGLCAVDSERGLIATATGRRQ